MLDRLAPTVVLGGEVQIVARDVSQRTLGVLCHVSGWLREYEAAARHAWNCGRREWVDCLLTMAEVEWEHDAYFRGRVLSRSSFDQEVGN